MEIFWIVPTAVSSSSTSSSSSAIHHPLSVNWASHNSRREDQPLSNFNPRSISNQQQYIGNHQNLLKEKKANFHGLYISVRDPLIDRCVNTNLKTQQQQRGEVQADCVCLWGSGIFCSRWQPEGLDFTLDQASRAVVSRWRCPTVHRHHQHWYVRAVCHTIVLQQCTNALLKELSNTLESVVDCCPAYIVRWEDQCQLYLFVYLFIYLV